MKNSHGVKSSISIIFSSKSKVRSLRKLTGGTELYAHVFLRTRRYAPTLMWLFFIFVFVFVVLLCMCLADIWSPVGKGLASRRFYL